MLLIFGRHLVGGVADQPAVAGDAIMRLASTLPRSSGAIR